MHAVIVVCDPEGAGDDDQVGISFTTLSPFIPRAGEVIRTQDGKLCTVQRVVYSVEDVDGEYWLAPHVYATFKDDETADILRPR